MNALEVTGLTKVYPEFTLDKVSFCVPQGHISGLIGRNGAGKSTTIKGRDIMKDEMTVKQMIGYRKKVKELSEGMKVKFALALALSHGAKLLIMDEPTSGLDPLSREEFCDIILQLVREEGVSVLFSTHITSDLMRIADDIVYISQGKILAACPLKELLDQYKVAHFSSLADATVANAIGVKSVKDGYEGLLLCDTQRLNGVILSDATIDNIIVHLEKANMEERYG